MPSLNITIGGSATLPSGVTLQAIDGGATYYADHGFTYAAANGWDDPGFFPLGVWYAHIQTQGDMDRHLDLGLNTAFRTTAPTSLALLRSNGMSALESNGESGTVGSECVGLISADEPSTYAEGFSTPIGTTANTAQDQRFWYVNMTWNWVKFGDIGGVVAPTAMSNLISTPNATTRHMDVQSVDVYFFSGGVGPSKYQAGQIYDLGRDMTTDEVRRGSWYGDLVDFIRPYTATYPAPVFGFMENGGPLVENTTSDTYITPPELNWGVWQNIIHGARGIMYFNHTFGGPAQSSDNFGATFYQTIQSGQSISIYNQAKATNALVKLMAPAINAPKAAGYLASVTPAATRFAGIDARATYRASTNKFTIFAATRASGAATGISATFDTAGTYTGPVTVVGESRTVTATAGTFSDTFALGSTVHIYEVPNA